MLREMSTPPPPPPAAAALELGPLGRPVRRRLLVPVSLVAGLMLAGALLVLHSSVRYYRVTSGSMAPTVAIGSRLAAVSGLTLRVGEIVVFRGPAGAASEPPVCGISGQGAGSAQPCGRATGRPSSEVLVKRIVAGPGDLVALRDGHAVVNGIVRAEPFAVACGGGPDCTFPVPVRVPAGEYFLLGDNRGASDDSRFWGPVPAAWILGVVAHCWPLQTACRAVG